MAEPALASGEGVGKRSKIAVAGVVTNLATVSAVPSCRKQAHNIRDGIKMQPDCCKGLYPFLPLEVLGKRQGHSHHTDLSQ